MQARSGYMSVIIGKERLDGIYIIEKGYSSIMH